MKKITKDMITGSVSAAYERAAAWLPPDIAIVLECFSETESDEAAREALCAMCERFQEAAEKNEPLCPKTDSVAVFADFGRGMRLGGNEIVDAIWAGLPRELSAELCLRDTAGDGLEISLAPFCRAMRRLDGVSPVADLDAAERFILSRLARLEDTPCAPVIIGVGFDSDMDDAVALSRRALTCPTDERSADPELARFEMRLTELGRGMSVGGFDSGVLATMARGKLTPGEVCCCAVSFGCHATRRKTVAL